MDNQKEIKQVDNRIRGAKSHLDLSLDFLIRAMKNAQEAIIDKAERTLAKASKIIHDLAWSVDNQGDHNDSSRSRKKRQRSESVSVLDTSVANEVQEAETDHGESGASLSTETVRFPVQECLQC